MPKYRYLPAPVLLLLCLCRPSMVAARQQVPIVRPSGEAIRVFLDCNTFCDFDHLRREITYVNWARDRQDADVHLIITSQRTGGGGREYRLRFIGLDAFKDASDEITFATAQSDSEDEIRRKQTQRIGLGLVRYVARSRLADRLQLSYTAPAGGDSAASQTPRDPWNLWVFTLGTSGHLVSQSRQGSNYLSGSFRARRVSDKWKVRVEVQGSRFKSRYELDDTTTVRSSTSEYNASALLVRSIGRHWSLGLNAGARRSSVENYDLLTRFAPGIEYDLFPYSESSRRQLVFVYEVAVSHANYTEETIFSKFRETRLSQAVTVALEAVQPWGGVEGRFTGLNYLDNWSQNRLSIDGGINLRLVRGLQLSLNASYSRVRDQISLVKADLTDQDVLLQLKQLKTSYTVLGAISLSYTFGSKFNNVVNPRFDSSRFDF